VFKIYEGDENALQNSDNPFDLAHYVGMQAWKQRGSDIRKLNYMKLLLAEPTTAAEGRRPSQSLALSAP
jgi:hypothetical protein